MRRLTPRETERLQGLEDDHTLVPYRGKPAADGPRYRCVGNGIAVPAVAWIGERLAAYVNATTLNTTQPCTNGDPKAPQVMHRADALTEKETRSVDP